MAATPGTADRTTATGAGTAGTPGTAGKGTGTGTGRAAAVGQVAGRAVRRVFPGPWGAWALVREVVGLLVLSGLAALIVAVAHRGPLKLTLYVAAVALLFLMRRGLPVPVLLVTAAGAGAIDSFSPLLVCAAWSAGYRVTRALPTLGVMAASFTLMTATAVLHGDDVVPAEGVAGFALGGFLLFAALPALAGRYHAQRRALVVALQERNDQLERERVMIAHQARLRERHRIAQDMHDSLGHQLALISVHSGALEVDRSLTDPQRAAVGVLRQAAVAAMRELRVVVGVLHEESAPPGAGRAGGGSGGGLDGIERLAEGSRAAGAAVVLSRTGEGRPLTAATEHAAYRIVQEALTNAHKHAPGAPLSVALRYEPDALVVEVANGPAPEPPAAGQVVSGGQGLTGLRERARLVGGMVHAGPSAGGGWRLAAVLPYDHDGVAAPAEGAADTLPGALPAGAAPAVPARATGRGVGRAARLGRPGPRNPAVGCAAGAAAVVLAVVGLLVWGMLAFVQALDDATVSKKTYESIAVGSAEADVRARLPVGSRVLTQGYQGTGPTPPAGASCSWYISDEPGKDGFDDEYVARFCFKDGTLIDKQHYRAKV
ncbi:histidine kinase [Kitasatospora sp. NBC_00240]|uniref:sensor histidine kinase n=1 Tax=Kitasatospora sp. NBC_00240 TaxID=2903567 RepID=UPI0022593EF3|nr:histidine kinase [Kitasatospora sp. NBC_00240]MCX5214432.1 histidine kinase [Kitasatospora sp. NBC_00240]